LSFLIEEPCWYNW